MGLPVLSWMNWPPYKSMSMLIHKHVHVACNISKKTQTLGVEGESSVKAKANGIAVNS